MKTIEAIEVFGVDSTWAFSRRREFISQQLAKKPMHWWLRSKARKRFKIKQLQIEMDSATLQRQEDIALLIRKIRAHHPTKGDINQDMIDRASAFPISQLVEFNRSGFASCIFHAEKTASMRLYSDSNSIHCFGCGRNASSIDIYMQIHKASFPEAVKKLCELSV